MDVFKFVQQLKQNIQAQKHKVVFIGVSGGSGSGKTSITQIIQHYFHDSKSVSVVQINMFYRDATPNIESLFNNQLNWDDPFMIDDALLLSSLRRLSDRQPVTIKKFDLAHSRRTEQDITIDPADIVIVEGIFAFHWPQVREMMKLRIFVDCCGEYRLMRRIIKDVRDYGKNCEQVIEQYHKFVKPSYEKYIQPQMKYAHLVLPWETMGSQTNIEAIELLINYINMVSSYSINTTPVHKDEGAE